MTQEQPEIGQRRRGAEVGKVNAQPAAPHKLKSRTFHYPGGLVDFIEHINRTRTRFIAASGFQPPNTGGIAIQCRNAGYSESVHTFANTINTRAAPEEDFRSA